MREILFRGKRIDNGEWESGGVQTGRLPHHEGKVWIIDKATNYLTPVDPATVGEYTGLADKNGLKVFEGDILKVVEVNPEVNEYSSPVRWESGEYLLDESPTIAVPLAIYATEANHQMNPLFEIEVIGNIHDNPEFLQEENKNAQ